jgi:hypothetical protein
LSAAPGSSHHVGERGQPEVDVRRRQAEQSRRVDDHRYRLSLRQRLRHRWDPSEQVVVTQVAIDVDAMAVLPGGPLSRLPVVVEGGPIRSSRSS